MLNFSTFNPTRRTASAKTLRPATSSFRETQDRLELIKMQGRKKQESEQLKQIRKLIAEEEELIMRREKEIKYYQTKIEQLKIDLNSFPITFETTEEVLRQIRKRGRLTMVINNDIFVIECQKQLLNFHIILMAEPSGLGTSRILLRPVGYIHKDRQQARKVNNFMEPTRQRVITTNQEIQLVSSEKSQRKRQPNRKPSMKFNLIEDPRESEFSYRKYVLLQKMLLILTLFYMLLCMIRTEILDKAHLQSSAVDDRELVIMMDITTLVIIMTVFLRLVCHNELKIDQKKTYCIRSEIGLIADTIRFIKIRHNLLLFLFEVIMILLHPSILFKDVKVFMFETYSNMKVFYDLNDLMCVLSLFRVYLVLRAMINITQYSTPRAVRLCNYNRINHDLFYSIKCLLQEHPLWSILAVFLTQVVVLGYGMRVTEGSVARENANIGPTGFENYINCFWCVFITMATVGYGDYYPKTLPGRAVVIFVAVSGIIVSSLLIVSLSAYLTMLPGEMTSHLTLVRLNHQARLKQQATQAMMQTMRLSKEVNSSRQKNGNEKIQQIFGTLKEKIDIVKYRSRQIKSLVNNNNIMEQMNRLFELLKESLIEVYQNQVTLKDDLMQLSKNKSKREGGKGGFLAEIVQI